MKELERIRMRILRFRIRDYKCIEDSGWVEIGAVTALVGKNESGKTTALEALQKFNSKPSVPFAVKDFPRPKQKSYDPEKVCVEVEVEPTKEERAILAEIVPDLKQGPSKFIIGKNYANLFIVDLGLPESYLPPALDGFLPELEADLIVDLKPEAGTLQQEMIKTIEKFESGLRASSDRGGEAASVLRTLFDQFKLDLRARPEYSQPAGKPIIDGFLKRIETKVKGIVANLSIVDRAEDQLLESLPSFIYFDEYEIIRGTTDIVKFAEARKSGHIEGEFKTMDNLVAMAGLNVEELIALGEEGISDQGRSFVKLRPPKLQAYPRDSGSRRPTRSNSGLMQTS